MTLNTSISTAQVLVDPTTGGVNDLLGQTASWVNASVQVNVVPEPVPMGVVGLGVGILGLRRWHQ